MSSKIANLKSNSKNELSDGCEHSSKKVPNTDNSFKKAKVGIQKLLSAIPKKR